MPETSAYVVKASDLQPILNVVTDNIGVILPFGVGITAILIGVGFVPRLIKKFSKG